MFQAAPPWLCTAPLHHPTKELKMKDVVQPRDFKAEFEAQRALTKKEIYKLKPGSWLIVKWLDAPNSLHMLLAKPSPEKGDVSLSVWNPVVPPGSHRTLNQTRITHNQVIGVHSVTEEPKFN
jgi:hypothetical protein